MLGMYSCNVGEAISIESKLPNIIEKFAQIAVQDLEIEPTKLLIKETDGRITVMFYNSRIRRFFDRSLERREHIFKSKNEYAASYLAGIFDSNGIFGYKGREGAYITKPDLANQMLLERLGFHTSSGRVLEIKNTKEFIALIKAYSAKLSTAHMPGNERDLR